MTTGKCALRGAAVLWLGRVIGIDRGVSRSPGIRTAAAAAVSRPILWCARRGSGVVRRAAALAPGNPAAGNTNQHGNSSACDTSADCIHKISIWSGSFRATYAPVQFRGTAKSEAKTCASCSFEVQSFAYRMAFDCTWPTTRKLAMVAPQCSVRFVIGSWRTRCPWRNRPIPAS